MSIIKRGRWTLACSLSLVTVAGPIPGVAFAQSSGAQSSEAQGAEPSDRQQAIETGILPKIAFEGETQTPATIEQRMESDAVSAVSIAVIRNGLIEWRQAYGETPKGPDSLFQAASMSKLVGSVGIVALAQERGFNLDADIMPALADVLDPRAVNPHGVPVTLRGLLSHTNGAGVSGFPGYADGEPVPTTLGVVLGAGGSNTPPVLIDPEKIGTFHYSGGGYTLAQLWAEHVSGESFAALMDRLVLDPIGMPRSTFALTPNGDDVARASDGFAGPVKGGWNTYPEAAAAGLWTTPSDYAAFTHALMRAMQGDGSAGIDPAVAAEIVQVVDDDYGLGVGVEDVNGSGQVRLRHSGGNRGYRTQFNAYPGRDEAVVVMTNAPGGWNLLNDIMRTATRIYDWPSEERVVKTRYDLSEQALRLLAGGYAERGKSEVAVTFSVDGRDLAGRARNGFTFRMVPIGPMTFIDPNEGGEITFRRDGSDIILVSNGREFVRLSDD